MPSPTPAHRALRIALIALGAAILLFLATALALLTWGWTWLHDPIERQLTARMGHAVHIGAIRRIDHGFSNATLAIDDIRVAQPDWVGGGDFATVRRARVQLPIWPILHGAFRPTSIELEGFRLHLIRRDAQHANWKGLPGGGGKGGGNGSSLRHFALRDGAVQFDDFKRAHFFRAAVSADDSRFQLKGTGTLIGRPTTLSLTGAGLLGAGDWPFRLEYRSPIANATLDARAASPLDIGHFAGRVTAWGDDLKHLDLIVEAGLPGTAPARIVADVRHDAPDWFLPRFDLTLGRSHATGTLDVRKQDGRTRLDGKLVVAALDFDDLANAEGRAEAAAKRAAAPGRRLPATRISLDHLLKTDGALDVDIRRLLSRQPTIFRGMRGHMALDHGVLTVAPFVTTLNTGSLGGTLRIAQTDAATRLHVDLRLTGGRIEALASDPHAFTGALAGRFLLDGTGDTIRAALGTANGRLAIVGRDGTLGRKTALLLGQDLGRVLRVKDEERAELRCGIGSFAVRAGQARPETLLLDTGLTRADATGLIDLTHERVDLSLTGLPKQKSALRIPGPIRVTGELFAPTVSAPEARSTKGLLKALGRALSGKPQPLATDADCAGLAARALR